MKKTISILAMTFVTTCSVFSQTKSSIAVATPAVQGLFITPKMTAKLLNIEMTKLNIYNVYDEFDMAETLKSYPEYEKECYGLKCLTGLGTALKTDYVITGSFDKLGNKIAITIKMVDVKNSTMYKTSFKEFDNQEAELQRMIEIVLREMNGLTNAKETVDQLSFKNEVITSNNVGRINNSGPRIGYAYLAGSLNEFATRSADQGGLDIAPSLSMIGYQFEKQYVGTESFSALFETIISVTGLEQSKFIPSIAFMNGFRFGKAGWEFAFGPSFGVKRVSTGFFDADDSYGQGSGAYWTESEYIQYDRKNYNDLNPYDAITQSSEHSAYEFQYDSNKNPSKYSSNSNLDNRGDMAISTKFVVGIGRTFRTGGLNIPVNIFYSSVKKGSMIGLSVGFNIIKKKENINNKK